MKDVACTETSPSRLQMEIVSLEELAVACSDIAGEVSNRIDRIVGSRPVADGEAAHDVTSDVDRIGAAAQTIRAAVLAIKEDVDQL